METTLINRSAVKQKALAYAIELKKPELTRVSADFAERVNSAVDAFIKSEIEKHPVDGKTIK
jgi:hypothetical protein